MTQQPSAAPVTTPAVRLVGLDGLRAIAVTLVLVYHLTPGALPGGFLGVDVFFPISGFLITSLLLRERTATGGLRVLDFWRRRARRLLPALGIVVLVCCGAAFAVGGDVLVSLGRQALGAATFSYNWLAIADGSSYLDQTTPELFRNLWSLAVEEQFYLVWPLLILGLWLIPSRRFRLAFVAALAVASAVLMAVWAIDGATTRVYYGADTHSFGLALGAALAIARHDWPGFAVPGSRRARTLTALAGLGSIGGLVALALTLPADAPLVYTGGLALVAVLAVVAIAAATVGRLGRVLDIWPLRWVGARSYGIYLWHWPVFVLLGAALPASADRWMLAGLALIITVVFAALSYSLVELPIRRFGLRASLARFGRQWRRDRWGYRPGAWVRASVVTLVFVVAASFTVGALVSDPGHSVAEARIRAGAAAIAAADAAAAASAAATPAPPAVPDGPPPGDQIVAIGDSVMLAVAPELTAAFPGITVDAVVSRQMSAAPEIAQAMVDAGTMRRYLVLGLGTNGSISVDTLQKVSAIVGRGTQIVLVNVQAPRGWTPGVNDALSAYATRMRSVELADWHTAIAPHLDVLAGDQIHAGGPAGGNIYVGVVTDALQRLVDLPQTNGPDQHGGERPSGR